MNTYTCPRCGVRLSDGRSVAFYTAIIDHRDRCDQQADADRAAIAGHPDLADLAVHVAHFYN